MPQLEKLIAFAIAYDAINDNQEFDGDDLYNMNTKVNHNHTSIRCFDWQTICNTLMSFVDATENTFAKFNPDTIFLPEWENGEDFDGDLFNKLTDELSLRDQYDIKIIISDFENKYFTDYIPDDAY